MIELAGSKSSIVSIDESGLTRVHLTVANEDTESGIFTIVETLPPSVDPKQVAVESNEGDWTVYEDGTIHWQTPVDGHAVATGTFGLPVTDVDTVDDLADPTTRRVYRGDSPTPEEAIAPVSVRALDDVSVDGRIPESVYEHVRELADGNDSRRGITAETDNTGSNDWDDVSDDTLPDGAVWEETASEEDGRQGTKRHDWAGDALQNVLRVHDYDARADENVYQFVLSFHTGTGRQAARSLLEGFLNGTTVFDAEPTLPELERGVETDELSVTVSSPLDEDALVGALERINGLTLETCEELDVDLDDCDDIETNAEQQFKLLDETIESTTYTEFADEVDDLEIAGCDFGAEPISFDDLIEDPDGAVESVAAKTDTEDEERTGETARDRIAASLLDELEAGSVSERERTEIRRQLGVEAPTSTEVQLDHLHARVNELAAYTDALEAFLDENGTAKNLLEGLNADVDRLHAETESLDERLDEGFAQAETQRTELSDRVTTVESTVRANGDRLDEVHSTVQSNRDDLGEFTDDVDSQLSELTDTVHALDAVVSDVQERLDDLEANVEQNSRVREKLESLAV